MNRHDSDGSLTTQLFFDFFGESASVASQGVKIGDFFVPSASDYETGFLPLGFPVLVHRSHEMFRSFFNVPFEQIEYEPYAFDFINPDADMVTFSIDNTPLREPYHTSIEDAFKHLKSAQGSNLVPLDWYAFVALFRHQFGTPQKHGRFKDTVLHRYRGYKRVTMVFADCIRGGVNKEPLYVLWEINVKSGIEQFKLSQNVRLHDLERGQTFVMCCVELKKNGHSVENVIFTEDVARRNSEISVADAMRLDEDTKYVLRFDELTKSGLSREDFIRSRGKEAFRLKAT